MNLSKTAMSAVWMSSALCAMTTAIGQTGVTTRVSLSSAGIQGDGDCAPPAMSADGLFVVFRSYANSLVVGDTNGAGDVFVRDRLTATTTRVSVDSNGLQGNQGSESDTAISAD